MAAENNPTRPTLDPTERTIEQLKSDITQLRDLVHAELRGAIDHLQIQITGLKEAAAAAGRSQAEAIGKAEVATEKAIAEMRTVTRDAKGAVDTQIAEHSGRLIRLEEARISEAKVSGTHQNDRANVVSIVAIVIGGLLALGTLAVNAINLATRPQSTTPVVLEPPRTWPQQRE